MPVSWVQSRRVSHRHFGCRDTAPRPLDRRPGFFSFVFSFCWCWGDFSGGVGRHAAAKISCSCSNPSGRRTRLFQGPGDVRSRRSTRGSPRLELAGARPENKRLLRTRCAWPGLGRCFPPPGWPPLRQHFFLAGGQELCRDSARALRKKMRERHGCRTQQRTASCRLPNTACRAPVRKSSRGLAGTTRRGLHGALSRGSALTSHQDEGPDPTGRAGRPPGGGGSAKVDDGFRRGRGTLRVHRRDLIPAARRLRAHVVDQLIIGPCCLRGARFVVPDI